jgi:uncharacterized LabA/DUF88 family protein
MNKTLLHKAQRVGIFIDTQNLYHSARSNYNANVNYKGLVEEAVAGRLLVRAFAYVIKSETAEESKFFDALNELGIENRVKDLQVFYNGEKKADWDVGIAIDIVRLSEKLDVVVLVSGDGDFAEVLKYVRSRGIRAEVMAFKKTTSMMLVDEADSFYDLGSNPGKLLIPTGKPVAVNNRRKIFPRFMAKKPEIVKHDVKPNIKPNIKPDIRNS